MASSHLLKDEHGNVVGYVLEDGKKLRIRVKELSGWVRVIVGSENKELSYELRSDNEEQVFDWTGEALSHARIESGRTREKKEGVLQTADTMAENAEDEKKEKKNLKNTCKKEDTSNVYKESEELRKKRPEAMMRRWPPPPCWPGSHYVNGEWRIKKTEDSQWDGTWKRSLQRDCVWIECPKYSASVLWGHAEQE